jgi:hypothetical protein
VACQDLVEGEREVHYVQFMVLRKKKLRWKSVMLAEAGSWPGSSEGWWDGLW